MSVRDCGQSWCQWKWNETKIVLRPTNIRIEETYRISGSFKRTTARNNETCIYVHTTLSDLADSEPSVSLSRVFSADESEAHKKVAPTQLYDSWAETHNIRVSVSPIHLIVHH